MEREKLVPRVPDGLLLIGLGSIWLGHWWWPGVMVVFGIAKGTADLLRKRYLQAAAVMLIFFGVPIASATGISWRLSIPVVLIAIGMIAIIKALVPQPPSRPPDSATSRAVGSHAHSLLGSPSTHSLMFPPNRVLWK